MPKIGLLVAALLLTPTAPAHASDDAVVQPIAVSPADQQAVRDYWTPSRIAALPSAPSTPPPGQAPVDGPDGSGGSVVGTVGRLFFTERGEDASCTGTLVDGGSVITAGHCLHTFDLIREDPQWSTNLLFVPGFHDGESPYGSYTVHSAIVDSHWIANDELDEYDQGFLLLNPAADGRTAVDAVGTSQHIAFDAPGAQEVREFGYPRSARQPGHQGRPEFTGQRQAQCWGPALERTGTTEWPVPRGLWGVACDMGGGSSGGPRIADFDTTTGQGTVVGVNTQGYSIDATGRECPLGDPTCTRHLGGPQLTSAITEPLYDHTR